MAGNLFEEDECLRVFGAIYATGALRFPLRARVLEVGCAEHDWMTPMLSVRPDLHIVGIDWRAADRPGEIVRGDVLAQTWPDGAFDVLVGISSVEHIGLGHYDHDPLDPDGDLHLMERASRWVRPGGWAYLDVPYDPFGYRVAGTSHRIYDEMALRTRLTPPPWSLTDRWYSVGGDPAVLIEKPTQTQDMTYVACLMTRDPQ